MATSLVACRGVNSDLPAPPAGYVPKECGVVIPYPKEFQDQIQGEIADMAGKGLYPGTRAMLRDYKTTRDDIKSCWSG